MKPFEVVSLLFEVYREIEKHSQEKPSWCRVDMLVMVLSSIEAVSKKRANPAGKV
jgi:hypothetical protein